MDYQKQLADAESEIIAEFGERFRAYGHDLALMRRLRTLGFDPKTIYDVGSSDGIWSAVSTRVFPTARFELFEPLVEISEEYRGWLQASHETKRFPASAEVQAHPVALGRRNGTCQMTVYPSAVGSTSLALRGLPEGARAVKVPSWKLDAYSRREKLPPPDLLKLDTQGSELEILQGAKALLPKVSAILCECWLFRGYGAQTPLWIEIADFLAPIGFFIYDMGWQYRRPDDHRLATVDLLFLRRDLPFSPLRHFSQADLR